MPLAMSKAQTTKRQNPLKQRQKDKTPQTKKKTSFLWSLSLVQQLRNPAPLKLNVALSCWGKSQSDDTHSEEEA
jgi:hypothetical protein